MCACVGAGGCADGTGRPAAGCLAGSETPSLRSPAWNLMPMDHQEWSGLDLLHYSQSRGRCVCLHALVNSRSGSLNFDAAIPGLR